MLCEEPTGLFEVIHLGVLGEGSRTRPFFRFVHPPLLAHAFDVVEHDVCRAVLEPLAQDAGSDLSRHP